METEKINLKTSGTGISEKLNRNWLIHPLQNARPKKPNEVPQPGKDPETVPSEEPEPATWPRKEPEITPGKEPLTNPPAAPPEIPGPSQGMWSALEML